MKRATLFWIAICAVVVLAQVLYFAGIHRALRTYRVPTGAMSPTIVPGEHVIICCAKDARVGDIVTFRFPQDERVSMISRIVAAAGDTVQIRDKRLFINDKEIAEPYVVYDDPQIYPDQPVLPEPYRSRDQFGPFVVPEAHYFTLSDNRDHSNDGRYWGALPAKNVGGRVVLIYSARGFRRPPKSSRIPPAPPPK